VAKKASDNVLELPVVFSNVNIGDKTCRLGISISRGNITPTQADKRLCGKRLTGTIFAAPDGVSTTNGQQALPGADGDLEMAGIFDVKGFTVSTKSIGAGLTFALASIDIETLAHFAKREGRIVITGVQELEADEEDEDE